MPAPLAPHPGTPGAKIRERREELGLTQTELAIAAGLTQAQVSRYERNESTPDLHELPGLADALHRGVTTVLHYWTDGVTGTDNGWFQAGLDKLAAAAA